MARGEYVEYMGHRHFIPAPLADLPGIELTGELSGLFGEAMNGIGQVEGLSKNIPYPAPLIRAYVTKEALLSSEIEGTIATLTEVMEAQGRERDPENRDVRDVLNYVDATDTTLRMLNEEKLPLVERVIREAHRVLLDSPAGEGKSPGEYRRVSVSVGRHVPPPASYIPDLMRDLERFLNADDRPPLVKAGIAHLQFETIHPFMDGNGRIGRLLIVLGLVHDGLLRVPLLYPSYYFKRFQSEYYARLDGVRTRDDWRGWLAFYLRAIHETALDTVARMGRLVETIQGYRDRIGRLSLRNADALLNAMLAAPVFDVSQLAQATGYTFAGANLIVKKLLQAGILRQHNTGRRFRSYRLEEYMNILEDDTRF